jgi:hypothetical protein
MMADYDQIIQALRNAHAAGDTAAAQRLAQMAKTAKAEPRQAMRERIAAAKAGTLEMQPGSAERATAADDQALAQMVPERTLGQTIYENVIGSGAVDTPGERLGELIGGVGAGAMRGAASLVGLPGTVGDLMSAGLQRAGLLTPNAPASPLSGGSLQESLADVTGGRSEFRAPGTAGEYAATIGEFLPGAMGGPNTMLRYGVLPAIGSETAGQGAEALGAGETGQAIARAVGAIGTSLLASRPGAFVGDDETARMSNVLRESGVDVSTGQGRGSQALMRMEGRLQATDDQLAAVTEATMRRFGSNAKVATPTNLAAIEKSLVDQMDNAVAGATIVPNAAQASAAVDVAKSYVSRVPAGQLTPRVRGIANEIKALAAAGKDVPLSRLKTWRSDIGALTVSPDAATREAAHALRTLLDDMTDTALTAAGRANDIQSLAKAREAYRDYIGVRDAASRAGAEAGILSPQALNQSMIRAQGREAYATGRSTPMTDFTRSAAATLRPAPATLPGGVRSIAEALPAALGAAGAGGAIGAGLGPLGAIVGGVGGALAPAVGQMAMRSPPMQALLRDPLRTITQTGRTVPGLLAQ